jgi:hypothetical protein
MDEIILEKAPLSIQERMEIYQNAYRIRLIESLSDDFENVESALGTEEFEKFAWEFIKHSPSKERNLAEYSQYFPEFLKAKSESLYELAIQDWMALQTLHAPQVDECSKAEIDEIEKGVPFVVKKYPASIIENKNEKFYLSYYFLDQVEFISLTQEEYQFLTFLENGKSLSEISEKVESNEFPEKFLTEKLANWMKNEIIYCEKQIFIKIQ